MAGTYLDCLPTQDILHGIIMPMLDYESRIHLNRVLPPIERYAKRIPKSVCLGHDGYIIMKNIKSHLNYIEERSFKKAKRCKKIIALIETLKTDKCINFIMNHPKFREAIVTKMNSFCNPAGQEISSASKYFKKKIMKTSENLLNVLEENSNMVVENFKVKIIEIM